MRAKTTKPQKQIKFRVFSKCNSSLRLTILLYQINTDFDSILDPLHLKHFLLFIHNHLFNKLTILMIKNSCSFNVNNQRWFFNDMIYKLLRKIETKLWLIGVKRFRYIIILLFSQSCQFDFFLIQMTNQLPICKKNKRKNVFFERITSLLGGERTPHSVALFSSIRLDAWVGVAKTLFSFQMKMKLQKKKIPNSCLVLLSSRKVDFQTNEKIALY